MLALILGGALAVALGLTVVCYARVVLLGLVAAPGALALLYLVYLYPRTAAAAVLAFVLLNVCLYRVEMRRNQNP